MPTTTIKCEGFKKYLVKPFGKSNGHIILPKELRNKVVYIVFPEDVSEVEK